MRAQFIAARDEDVQWALPQKGDLVLNSEDSGMKRPRDRASVPVGAERLEVMVADLLDRVLALEDRAEIMTLIASYGPLVDSGDGHGAAGLWTPDGRYEVAGFSPWVGRPAIATIVDGPGHLRYLARGSAHAMGLPKITLSGDQATAVNYTQVFVRDSDKGEWVADRVSVHLWELVRLNEGWRVENRRAHALDGSPPSVAFLKSVATRIADGTR